MDNSMIVGRLMEFMQSHKGLENIVRRDEVLAHLRRFRPELNDRDMRELYAELPICSSAKHHGLFLPATRKEIEASLREYEKQAGPIHASIKRKILYGAYPQFRLNSWKQEELFP